MINNRLQIALAAAAIVAAAVLSHLLIPTELMARSAAAPNLENAIPRQFGTWTMVPDISPVTPADPENYQPDLQSSKIYTQEVARGYTDGNGNIVMFLVAYGPVQNYRLRAHRPEICYTAAGFRTSGKTDGTLQLSAGTPPLKVVRLLAQRESRFEPITYWMRVGNIIANGVVKHQLTRLEYGLRGIVPDGALVRVSTVGLPEEASFRLQEKFIHDLLAALPLQERNFLTGKG